MTNPPTTTAVITAGDSPVADFADRFTTGLTSARPTRMIPAAACTDLDAVAREVDILVVAASVSDGRLPLALTRLLEQGRGTRSVVGSAFALCVAEPSDRAVVERLLKPALAAAGLLCPTPGLTLPPRQDPGPAIASVCRYWRFAVPGMVQRSRQVAA